MINFCIYVFMGHHITDRMEINGNITVHFSSKLLFNVVPANIHCNSSPIQTSPCLSLNDLGVNSDR